MVRAYILPFRQKEYHPKEEELLPKCENCKKKVGVLLKIAFKEVADRHIRDRFAHISRRSPLISRKIIYIGLSLPLAHIYIAVIRAKTVEEAILVFGEIDLLAVIGDEPILV